MSIDSGIIQEIWLAIAKAELTGHSPGSVHVPRHREVKFRRELSAFNSAQIDAPRRNPEPHLRIFGVKVVFEWRDSDEITIS